MEMSGYIYRASAGETFDSVSLAVWGDEKYASALLTANPGLCRIYAFSGGEELKIPVVALQREDADGGRIAPVIAPWKE